MDDIVYSLDMKYKIKPFIISDFRTNVDVCRLVHINHVTLGIIDNNFAMINDDIKRLINE